MAIKGYGESLGEPSGIEQAVFDGSELMERPGFWAAYFLSQSIEDDVLLAEAWGVEPVVVRGMQELLSTPSAWPVFEVSIRNGAKLVVVYRNLEDDPGVDYLVVPRADQGCIRIATLEGEYEGPGISWRELLAVAQLSADPMDQAKVLLLLAPMLGDVEAATGAGLAILSAALRTVGGVGDIESVAELIAAENLQWEPAQWHTTSEGLTVCDSESSPRNPGSVNALASADLRTVSDLLAI
ncbi:hypothetical protein ACFU7Y_26525 [Kitasatospora sp. NPDC057542]|uniref:hypothetical protein n=1 Tax=Kitasatospora sp. NPDC057542 TaxID=3346162 RepID=UPI0036966777